MINNLISELENLLKKYQGFTSNGQINKNMLYLIYLKYLCEKKVYNYEDVIDNNGYTKINVPIIERMLLKKDIPINSLLRNISYCDVKDLLKEYIKIYQIDEIYPIKEKRIVYDLVNSCGSNFYDLDLSSYDVDGNTIYIYDDKVINNSYELYHLFDEILENNNEYFGMQGMDFTKSNYLYIYDNMPKYRFIKNDNIYNKTLELLKKINNIVIYSKYAKIGNFKEGRIIIHYLSTIIIRNENVALLINKDNEFNDVAIINYNDDKISSIDKLKEISEKRRKQKDVLTKVTYEDIRHNNMRIGFNLYQMQDDQEIQDINKLVDNNTQLLASLNDLNIIVEEEFNKIINK